MQQSLLHGGTIVRSDGQERSDILIEDGVIQKIGNGERHAATADGIEVIDVAGKFLLPGLIDCHVHFREPGLMHKGDMTSESRSALAGGVSTVCDMPNTVPPTVTVAALAEKLRCRERRPRDLQACDIRFFFGVTEARHLLALRNLWLGGNSELRRLRAGCCGVKLYLDHSTGNQKIASDLLGEAFSLCSELDCPVVCHCEDPEINADAARQINGSDGPMLHARMRPPESEAASAERAISLARRHGTRLHIAHLSTEQGLALVRSAKRDALPVTCEAAPHHLFLTTEDADVLGTFSKVNPPLRSREHQEALWAGIADGTVDCIATDHAPHTLAEKHVPNWRDAPSGMPGVETLLPLLLTVAAGSFPHPRSTVRAALRIDDIVRLCFANPNRIFRLGKSGIQEGANADITVVDPTKEWVITGKALHAKCGWTPYEGWRVTGAVERVVAST